MFPVHTGINRGGYIFDCSNVGVPCTHRDKPVLLILASVVIHVFPVHTGINRDPYRAAETRRGVPCTHRDKPNLVLYRF